MQFFLSFPLNCMEQGLTSCYHPVLQLGVIIMLTLCTQTTQYKINEIYKLTTHNVTVLVKP